MHSNDWSENFRVVCLGGSAGGLQAYRTILRTLPARPDMAFVIATHRAPDNADLLRDLLSHDTAMPVVEVSNGMRLEPNRVFLMPPRTDLTTSGNFFHLRTTPEPRGWPKTINLFLFSLAESIGPRAVAVILSGLDGDGSAALRTIKVVGGITFAQSDAIVKSMPREAVETGHVDYFLPAAEIARALKALAHKPLGFTPRVRFKAVNKSLSPARTRPKKAVTKSPLRTKFAAAKMK